MKLKKLNLTHLHNEEHFQLMTDFTTLLRNAPVSIFPFTLPIAEFGGLWKQEDQALEVIRKNALTNTIADADAKRDDLYKGLTLQVKTYSYSAEAAKREAARNIQVVIDHYGDFRTKAYNEETATIVNFLQELNNSCASHIAAIGAGHWVNDLSAANEEFQALMYSRYDDIAREEVINLRETRKAADKVYKEIVDRINAYTLLNGGEVYADFVRQANERIDYYKQTLAQRRGRAEAKKEETVESK